MSKDREELITRYNLLGDSFDVTYLRHEHIGPNGGVEFLNEKVQRIPYPGEIKKIKIDGIEHDFKVKNVHPGLRPQDVVDVVVELLVNPRNN